jgi:hypothetical protein
LDPSVAPGLFPGVKSKLPDAEPKPEAERIINDPDLSPE